MMPEKVPAIGLWYDDFSEATDDEIRDLLAASKAPETTAERAETADASASGAPR